MSKTTLLQFTLSLTSMMSFSCARADVAGERSQFRSSNGLNESCVRLSSMPGAKYSSKDIETEKEFCAIDLSASNVAMCPKTWSTSPGTMIYDTEGTSQSNYEATRCAGKNGHKKLAKFKSTMNSENTSSTFSTSSLLYYHFSRYFNTTVDVPVSVYRSIDKDVHFERVSKHAVGSGRMNPAAWSVMRAAELNPSSYGSAIDELFTADRKQIYGILLKDKGTGYGPEIDGTEEHGWGTGSNNDFQETPAFLALRSEKELRSAINEGVAQGIQNSIIRKAMGPGVSAEQMVYWMKEITEFTLLDYIFSQQDRIQNIDYVWEWTYIDGSGVKSVKVKDERYEKLSRPSMAKIPVPSEIAAFKPLLLQRTSIGDNDAGGRVQYTNFTKKTQMLEKIRHYNAETYRTLISLNKDLSAQGPVFSHVASTFGLTAKQIAQIVSNTASATAILKSTCEAGLMRFDLNPKKFFVGQVGEESVNCANP